MTIESVRKICRALPEVTEDVKWGNDLCFCISGKMFAAVGLNPPLSASSASRHPAAPGRTG